MNITVWLATVKWLNSIGYYLKNVIKIRPKIDEQWEPMGAAAKAKVAALLEKWSLLTLK